MSESFDPYYKWLAIPPDEQPPNHYRLLGIPLYTDDADVISHAADQRMSHIRSFQSGNHATESQRILNELANARLCLLNRIEKAAYDAALQENSVPQVAPLAQPLPRPVNVPTEEPPPLPSEDSITERPIFTEAQGRRSKPRQKKRKPTGVSEFIKIAVGSVGGLAIGYLILCLIGPQYDFLGLMAQSPDGDTEVALPTESPRPSLQERKTTPTPIAKTVNDGADTNSAQPTSQTPTNTHPSPAPDSEQERPEHAPPVGPPPLETKEQRIDRLTDALNEATESGDISLALAIVKEIAEISGEDPLDSQTKHVLDYLNSEAADTDVRKWVEAFIQIIGDALASRKVSFAKKHQDNLLRLARESGDDRLVRQATLLVLKIQQSPTETINSIELRIDDSSIAVEPIDNTNKANAWVNLLSRIDLEQHVLSGKWQRRGESVVSTVVGKPSNLLALPYTVGGDYDLLVVATRLQGSRHFVVALPVGDRHVHLSCFDKRQRGSGLERINGKSKADNGTFVKGIMANGDKVTLDISVTFDDNRVKIQTRLNNSAFVTWEGPISSLSSAESYPVGQPALGSSGDVSAAFYECRIRTVVQ